MGLVSGHGEADSRGPHSFFAAGDGEMGKDATGWDLVAGRSREHYEGNGNSVCMDIYQQEPSNGGTVGGPLYHIRILRMGDWAQGRGVETGPVVAADGNGFPTEGYANIYFRRRMGVEVTGIW